MPAPFEMPGYYWDEQRGKFFKIENTATAPAGARWSRQEVRYEQQREQLAERRRGGGGGSRAGRATATGSRMTPTATMATRASRPGGRSEDRYGRQGRRSRARRDGPGDGGGRASEVAPRAKRMRMVGDGSHQVDDDGEEGDEGDEGDEDDSDNGASPAASASAPQARRAPTRLVARAPQLARETGGGAATTTTAGASSGQLFAASAGAAGAAAYAGDLGYVGAVPVLDEEFTLRLEPDEGQTRVRITPFTAALDQPRILSGTAVSCMYVHGDAQPPGLGMVYTNYTAHATQGIKGQYIMVDDDERVTSSWPRRLQPYAAYERTRPERIQVTAPSAICYHESSRNLIVTSRSSDHLVQVFSPFCDDGRDGPGDGVSWKIGATWRSNHPIYKISGDRRRTSVNACAPSPQGFNSLCVVGTTDGLSVIDLAAARGLRRDLDLGAAERCALRPTDQFFDVQDHGPPTRARLLAELRRPQAPGPRPSKSTPPATARVDRGVITTVDYVGSHPDLVLAGGRCADPWLIDLRMPPASKTAALWCPFGGSGRVVRRDDVRLDGADDRRRNAVAHVRSAGAHHVVAAGLRDTMLLYDLRYLGARRKTSSSARPALAAEPLLRFANYYNDARLTGLGFAVDASLGVVAVGEEHAACTGLGGGVALFSLATGERLGTPGISAVSHAADVIASVYRYPPHSASVVEATGGSGSTAARRPLSSSKPRVEALSFASLPGEGTSLFAAVGAHVCKFSLGRHREEDF